MQLQRPKVSKWKEPVTLSTIVIAIATLANLVVAVLMWTTAKTYTKVTRDIYEAANRPYIGIETIRADIDDENKALAITVEMKNVGTVPARDVVFTWTRLQDGKEVPVHHSISGVQQSNLVVFFPQMGGISQYRVEGDEYTSIVTGRVPLEMNLGFEYKGITAEKFYYRLKTRYVYRTNDFQIVSGEAR